MFFIMFVFVFLFACFANRDGLFVASGLFAIASAIEHFGYRYSKK